MSKSVLKDAMSISDIESNGEYSRFENYKYVFKWDPQPNPNCRPSCKDIFSSMRKCKHRDSVPTKPLLTLGRTGGDGAKSEMAKTASATTNCGTALYKIEDRNSPEPKFTCRKHSLRGPRGDKEADGATSLDKAITDYCTNNDGKEVEKGESVYQRWGVTDLGVPNRSSFWLRSAITCDD
jgi:hypothetical protein